MSTTDVADVVRWVMILTSAVFSGGIVWRVLRSPRLHQRLITASAGLFGVLAVSATWSRLGTKPDILRLTLEAIALGLGCWGLIAWKKLEHDQPPGSFGLDTFDSRRWNEH
jgi:hypothetical protein